MTADRCGICFPLLRVHTAQTWQAFGIVGDLHLFHLYMDKRFSLCYTVSK